jgi:hypothetical protein
LKASLTDICSTEHADTESDPDPDPDPDQPSTVHAAGAHSSIGCRRRSQRRTHPLTRGSTCRCSDPRTQRDLCRQPQHPVTVLLRRVSRSAQVIFKNPLTAPQRHIRLGRLLVFHHRCRCCSRGKQRKLTAIGFAGGGVEFAVACAALPGAVARAPHWTCSQSTAHSIEAAAALTSKLRLRKHAAARLAVPAAFASSADLIASACRCSNVEQGHVTPQLGPPVTMAGDF